MILCIWNESWFASNLFVSFETFYTQTQSVSMHVVFAKCVTLSAQEATMCLHFICFATEYAIEWIDERAWVSMRFLSHRLRTINSNKMQHKSEIQAKQIHESHEDFMHTAWFWCAPQNRIHSQPCHSNDIWRKLSNININCITTWRHASIIQLSIEMLSNLATRQFCKCFTSITHWKSPTSHAF